MSAARSDPLPEIQKIRPCVIITSDVLNVHRRTVVVVPLSTSPQASPPLLIDVRNAGAPAVAVPDQIRAVTKERLREKLGAVSRAELRTIEDGLREILEL